MLIGDSVMSACNLIEPFLNEGLPPPTPSPLTWLDRFLGVALSWTNKSVRPMQGPQLEPSKSKAPMSFAKL